MADKKIKIEIVKSTELPLSVLDTNKGQIDGVPENPRFITSEDFDNLCKSIQDDPEMLELRELLVYPLEGRYVVIGGNMRLQAMRYLQFDKAPCKILASDTPKEKLIAIILKDNQTYGEWAKFIQDEWSDCPLEEWGVTFAKQEQETEQEQEKGEEGKIAMKFVFSPEQFKHVKQKLNSIDKDDNANAVMILIQEYNERNKA